MDQSKPHKQLFDAIEEQDLDSVKNYLNATDIDLATLKKASDNAQAVFFGYWKAYKNSDIHFTSKHNSIRYFITKKINEIDLNN